MKRSPVVLVAAALFVAARVTPAAAEEKAGDPKAGLAFAEEVCSRCHSVGAGAKTSPEIKAPPFQVIASSKLVTSREIEAWLMSSHPDMPDLMVAADKRADILAYLKSLGHKQ